MLKSASSDLLRNFIRIGKFAMKPYSNSNEKVLFSVINNAGLITLNRPNAMNSFDIDVILAITNKLEVNLF